KIYSTRGVILSSYITLLVLILIALGIIFLMKRKLKDNSLHFIKMTLLAAFSSPLWFLVLSPVLKYVSSGLYFWVLTLLSILTGFLLYKFTRYPIQILSGALFLLLTMDLIAGTPFMQRSYLGYDPIIGARFYGIGNEYAGIYIISGFLFLTYFWGLKKGM